MQSFDVLALCHEQADLFLGGRARIHKAGDAPGADDQDPVAELKQHVQVLADEDDGDAGFLLCVQELMSSPRTG